MPSRTGSIELTAGARACDVCCAPLDKSLGDRQRAAHLHAAAQENATAFGAPAAQGVAVYKSALGLGRAGCKVLDLHEVVLATLDLLCELGGRPAVCAIKQCIPTFDRL